MKSEYLTASYPWNPFLRSLIPDENKAPAAFCVKAGVSAGLSEYAEALIGKARVALAHVITFKCSIPPSPKTT